jgi:ribosomal protein L37E
MPRTSKKIQGICDKCGVKVIVPSWKYCADCDFKKFRTGYILKLKDEIKKIELAKKEIKEKKIIDNQRIPKRLRDCVRFVIDDNTGKIIGGQRFIYRLRE